MYRLRAYVRTTVSPTVALVALVAAVAVRHVQRAAPRLPAPTPGDVLGRVTIASLHSATLVGVVLVAVTTASCVAARVADGTIDLELLVQPRPARLLGRKAIAAGAVLAVWMALVIVLLRTVRMTSDGGVAVTSSRVALSTLALSVGAACFVITLSHTVALLTRSPVMTVLSMLVLYSMPGWMTSGRTGWLLPSRWVTEGYHLEPRGAGTDYLGVHHSLFDSWTDRGPYGVGLLIVGSMVLWLVNPRLFRWALDRPLERA